MSCRKLRQFARTSKAICLVKDRKQFTLVRLSTDVTTTRLGVKISSTFYEQLLWAQILKAQKDTGDLTVFLHFWDLRGRKMLVKLTSGVNFINFNSSFCHSRIMLILLAHRVEHRALKLGVTSSWVIELDLGIIVGEIEVKWQIIFKHKSCS